MSFCHAHVAEKLDLPVNRPVLVSIDERLIRAPRGDGRMNAAFSAGIRCGMLYVENLSGTSVAEVVQKCDNAREICKIAMFDAVVNRQDGQQLLLCAGQGTKGHDFVAIDYGYCFGGNPTWRIADLSAIPAPQLADMSILYPGAKDHGAILRPFVAKLKTLTAAEIKECFMRIHPPRWGFLEEDLDKMGIFIQGRAASLIQQFSTRYGPELEGL